MPRIMPFDSSLASKLPAFGNDVPVLVGQKVSGSKSRCCWLARCRADILLEGGPGDLGSRQVDREHAVIRMSCEAAPIVGRLGYWSLAHGPSKGIDVGWPERPAGPPTAARAQDFYHPVRRVLRGCQSGVASPGVCTRQNAATAWFADIVSTATYVLTRLLHRGGICATYVAQREDTTTLSPFGHATVSGLRVMPPPHANPAHPSDAGEMI